MAFLGGGGTLLPRGQGVAVLFLGVGVGVGEWGAALPRGEVAPT